MRLWCSAYAVGRDESDEEEDVKTTSVAWLTKVAYEKQPTLAKARKERAEEREEEPEEIDRQELLARIERSFAEAHNLSNFKRPIDGAEPEWVVDVLPDMDQWANSPYVVRFGDTNDLQVSESTMYEAAPLLVMEGGGKLHEGPEKIGAFYVGEKDKDEDRPATKFRPVKRNKLAVHRRKFEDVKQLLLIYEEGGDVPAKICPTLGSIKVQGLSKTETETERLKQPIHLVHRAFTEDEEQSRLEGLTPYVQLAANNGRARDDDPDSDDDDDDDDL